MHAAAGALARCGLWPELSAAAGVAGLRDIVRSGAEVPERSVCIMTSSGMKIPSPYASTPVTFAGDWDVVDSYLEGVAAPVG